MSAVDPQVTIVIPSHAATLLGELLIAKALKYGNVSDPLHQFGNKLVKASKAKRAAEGIVRTRTSRQIAAGAFHFLGLIFHPSFSDKVSKSLSLEQLENLKAAAIGLAKAIQRAQSRRWSGRDLENAISNATDLGQINRLKKRRDNEMALLTQPITLDIPQELFPLLRNEFLK